VILAGQKPVIIVPMVKLKTSWTRNKDSFELDVTIPANTTATIYLPGNSKPVKTGSGNYHYSISLK
jgi:alpha-L-rhamnosidase